MSSPVSYTSAVTFIPVSYADGANAFTQNSSYPITNAYADSNSSNYARLTVPATANINCQIYFNFDKDALSSIPSIATINSVTGKVRYALNNTSTNRFNQFAIQLYTNTTAKGSPVSTRSTTNTVYNLTAGTWTLSEIQNMYLSVSATRGTSTQSAYINFYGADVTINYSVNTVEYEITINNSTTITTDPSTGTTYVYQGEDKEIKFNTTDVSDLTVTDNGSSVELQAVYESVLCAMTVNPNTYSAATNTVGNPTRGYNNTGNTSQYATLSGSTTQRYTYYGFSTTSIPNNATIISVSCDIRAASRNGTGDTYVGYAQLMGNEELKGDTRILDNTAATVFTLVTGDDWSLSDVQTIKLRLSHPTGNNRVVRFYGANLTINYSLPGTGGTIQYYTYTISNISADHTIVISEAVTEKMFIKVNNAWVPAVAVHKKINGSWVRQTDLTNVFESGEIYLNNL